MKSPNEVYPSTDTLVVSNGGSYILAIRSGDLQLLLYGSKRQVYWSLKQSVGVLTDLSNVKYAGMFIKSCRSDQEAPNLFFIAEVVMTGRAVIDCKVIAARIVDDQGGIGLYTAANKLVYRIMVLLGVVEYGADNNFGLDFYGNLNYNLMYKGFMWGYGWQAITNYCTLPRYCGDYGICTTFLDQFGDVNPTCTGFALTLHLSGCMYFSQRMFNSVRAVLWFP